MKNADRNERLAKALRENLKRRKARKRVCGDTLPAPEPRLAAGKDNPESRIAKNR